jgi:hypothetical protein
VFLLHRSVARLGLVTATKIGADFFNTHGIDGHSYWQSHDFTPALTSGAFSATPGKEISSEAGRA